MLRTLAFFIILCPFFSMGQNLDQFSSVEDALLTFSDSAFVDFHLNNLTDEMIEDLIEGKDIRTEEDGLFFILRHDTTFNTGLGIAYSKNPDEGGYILNVYHAVHKKRSKLVFILEAGDHCCDWVEHVKVCERKKGEWIWTDPQKVFPQPTWDMFLENVPEDTAYTFLSDPPPYNMESVDAGYRLRITFDYIDLSYENGAKFLKEIDKELRKVHYLWNEKKGKFEPYYYDIAN